MITVARDIWGNRMLRTSKMVLNSGYLPLTPLPPDPPGLMNGRRQLRSGPGRCRWPRRQARRECRRWRRRPGRCQRLGASARRGVGRQRHRCAGNLRARLTRPPARSGRPASAAARWGSAATPRHPVAPGSRGHRTDRHSGPRQGTPRRSSSRGLAVGRPACRSTVIPAVWPGRGAPGCPPAPAVPAAAHRWGTGFRWGRGTSMPADRRCARNSSGSSAALLERRIDERLNDLTRHQVVNDHLEEGSRTDRLVQRREEPADFISPFATSCLRSRRTSLTVRNCSST